MIKKLLPTLASFALIGLGYVLSNSYQYKLCSSSPEQGIYDVSCSRTLTRIGDPLFYGAAALAIVFLVLLFVPKAFPIWKKFAIWFVPLATLIFILYQGPGAFDLFSPYPETVYRWVSGLYVAVSLLLVGKVLIKKS
jgi:hypothetical protein